MGTQPILIYPKGCPRLGTQRSLQNMLVEFKCRWGFICFFLMRMFTRFTMCSFTNTFLSAWSVIALLTMNEMNWTQSLPLKECEWQVNPLFQMLKYSFKQCGQAGEWNPARGMVIRQHHLYISYLLLHNNYPTLSGMKQSTFIISHECIGQLDDSVIWTRLS